MVEKVNERFKQFEAVINGINNSYKKKTKGDNLITKLPDAQASVERFSSGSFALDSALGGGLPKGRIIEIYGKESSGKCLTPDSVITTSHGLLTLEELIYATSGLTLEESPKAVEVDTPIQVLNENGKYENIKAVTFNGSKKVRKVTLSDGRNLTATLNHPVRVLDKNSNIIWKEFNELVEGDYLVSNIKHFNSELLERKTIKKNTASLLGAIIANAYWDKDKLTYVAKDVEDKEHFVKMAKKFAQQEKVKLKYEESNKSIIIESRKFLNILYSLLDSDSSVSKSVPSIIRMSNVNILISFLRELFEGDARLKSTDMISYYSTHRTLIKDVQLILRGFNIKSTIKYNKLFIYDVYTYMSLIGFVRDKGYDFEDLVDEKTIIPYVGRLMNDFNKSITLGKAEDIFGTNVTSKELLEYVISVYSLIERGDVEISEHSNENLMFEKLLNFAYNNYTYDEIVSIEDLDEVLTYDISTEYSHSFVANGIINHNTSIAITAVGNVQKNGGNAVFIDAEQAFDPDYAKKLGMDTDNIGFAQPSTAEQALDLMNSLADSGVVDVIILDSVAALVPKAELEGEAGDITIGLLARIMSKELRKMLGHLRRNNCTAIFINQIRDDIGKFSPRGTPTTTPGGKALKFYASQRILVTKAEKETEDGKTIGNKLKFTIIKNKTGKPYAVAESILTFDNGINKGFDIIDIAVKYGVINRPSKVTYVRASTGEILVSRGKASLGDYFNSNPEVLEEVSKELFEAMNDNENNVEDFVEDITEDNVNDDTVENITEENVND